MVGHLILLNSRNPMHKAHHIATINTDDNKLPPLNKLVEAIEETRESILISNTLEDARWESTPDSPARSVVIVPMFGRLNLIGLLVLVHEQASYFKVEHQLLLQAIASQAAIAVENARLYMNKAQEQQKLNAILQSAADPILMFNADESLSMLNPAANGLFTDYETKLGLPLARGRGFDDLLGALETTYTSGSALSKEITWPDGRIFNALFTPVGDGSCVVALQDVTHFKKLEKVKNEFIATASHDLRNPITTIKGYSQLIQQAGPLNENQIDFAQRIQRAAEHMTELVENMLDLAKMDLNAETKFEMLEIAPVLWQLADEFQPQAEAKKQLLVIGQNDCDCHVQGDALRLRQALRNLIGNAVKYTPGGGTITLAMKNCHDKAQVSIQDTGYGIPASDLPHIFNRFYRVRNNGHDQIEGNGLGLAIVKSVVEQHGGQIGVESDPGKGTCFTVTLPIMTPNPSQDLKADFPEVGIGICLLPHENKQSENLETP
jgi:signal transduction histidine kinase